MFKTLVLAIITAVAISGCSKDFASLQTDQGTPSSILTKDVAASQPAAGTVQLTDGRNLSTSDQHNVATTTTLTVVYNGIGGQDVEVNGIRVKAPSSSSSTSYSGSNSSGSNYSNQGSSYNGSSGSGGSSSNTFSAQYGQAGTGLPAKIGLIEFCNTSSFRVMFEDPIFGSCPGSTKTASPATPAEATVTSPSPAEQLVLKQFDLIAKLTDMVDRLEKKLDLLTSDSK
jgi:hypothetical protein